MIITIDIETDYSHDPEVIRRVCQKVTPPANYKSEEAIEKWWRDKGNNQKVEAQRKTALSPLWGSVKMIGMAIADKPVSVITGPEEEVLSSFIKVMSTMDDALLVGHNIIDFDLPFIRNRSMIHGLAGDYHKVMNIYHRRYSSHVFDTMREFAGYRDYVKLDDLAYAFLGERKTSDGAASLEMTDEECRIYCAKDVSLTRKIYQRMTGAV